MGLLILLMFFYSESAAWAVADKVPVTAHPQPSPTPGFPSPPPLEDALIAAKKVGKVLVLEFGAEWCGPCKQLEEQLLTPEGKAILDLVHFVRYDIDEEPGSSVRNQFQVFSFPTLIAINAEGVEVERRGGSNLQSLRSWFERINDLSTTLEETLSRADLYKNNVAYQLQAGKRLVSAHRPKQALRYFSRVIAGDDSKLAAEATWALADTEIAIQTNPIRRKYAERLIEKFPTAPEALKALRFLAIQPKPPHVLIGQLIERRVAHAKTASELEELALYGLRGSALAATLKAASRLESLAQGDPMRLLTVAEVHFANGKIEQAKAMAERVLVNATEPVRQSAQSCLARFNRGDRSPSLAVRGLKEKGIEPRQSVNHPTWLALANKVIPIISKECTSTNQSLNEVQLFVFSGAKPEDLAMVTNRVLPEPIRTCIDRVVRNAGVPANQSFSLPLTLDSPTLAKSLAAAKKMASACLLPPRASERKEPMQMVLASTEGRRRVIVAGGQNELKQCLEDAFKKVSMPANTVRAFHILPPRPETGISAYDPGRP